MKIIFKQTEKLMAKDTDSSMDFHEYVRACTVAIDLTCKEKVIKVFMLSIQLLSLLIISDKVELLGCVNTFKDAFIERTIVQKLL